MFLAQLMHVPFAFDAKINLLAVAFSDGIGVLFGYLPACAIIMSRLLASP